MTLTAKDFDERCQAVATVTKSTMHNGQMINAGDIITPRVDATDDAGKHLGFPLPNVTALFIHAAEQAYAESKSSASLKRQASGHADKHSDVFDFLEKRMATVVYAYSALEAFANELIPANYSFAQLQKKSGLYVPQSQDEIERRMPLSEKLLVVLPDILGIAPPKKGTSMWNRFRNLEDLRDRIIHCKVKDRRSSGPRDKSLWNALLGKQFRNYPADAQEIMEFFVAHDPRRIPKWLGLRLDKRASRKK